MPGVDDVSEAILSLDTAVYADGDLLCQAVELVDVCAPNFPAFIVSATLLDYDDQAGDLTLVFFRANPGHLGAINAAMAINNAQAEMVLCVISIATADYTDLGAQCIGQPEFYPRKVRALDGSSSLWVAAQAGAASTYASGRMLLKVGVVRVE